MRARASPASSHSESGWRPGPGNASLAGVDPSDEPLLQFAFDAEILHWRGPSPYFFAPLPAHEAAEVRRVSRAVTYGWGVIPVEAEVAGVAFTTSLFPKDDGYLLPLKDAVRRKAAITAGDTVAIGMIIRPPKR